VLIHLWLCGILVAQAKYEGRHFQAALII